MNIEIKVIAIKRLLATLSTMFMLAVIVNALTTNNGAKIKLEEKAHNFGILKQGDDASTEH